MQTYAQRALQARIHDASQYMVTNTSTDANGKSIGSSTQYEPYYMNSDYNVDTNSVENKRLGKNLVGADSTNYRTRIGAQSSTYNSTSDMVQKN